MTKSNFKNKQTNKYQEVTTTQKVFKSTTSGAGVKKSLSTQLYVSPFKEFRQYNQSLHQRTLFPYRNTHRQSEIERAVVSFRFRSIEFSKKRALPFFLAMELLTNRKCVASLSRQNIQA